MTDAARGPLHSRRVLVAVVVLAALALSGCSVISGDDPSLPNGTEAADRYRSLDGYSATVTIDQADEPTERLRIWVAPESGNTRSEVLAPPSRAGNIGVANNSTIIRYNATDNEYIRISTTDVDRFDRGARRIQQAVAAARSEGETTSAPPFGGAPLPVVPDSETRPEEDAQFVVTYDGTESVAGRTAHVLNYTAAGDRSQGVLRQTIWLDTESFVTLKMVQVSRFDGNRSRYTFELSNVTVDTDFDAERFAFDPPPGATLNESESFDVTSYDSLDALGEASPLSVPDPAVPERYRLVTADRIDGVSFDAVQLRYRAGTSSLFVTKTTEQSYTNTTTGDPVTIGNRTGRYRSTGARSLVAWECGENVYVVTGDVQKETVVAVARSVACA